MAGSAKQEKSIVFSLLREQMSRMLGNTPLWRKGGSKWSEFWASLLIRLIPEWYIPSRSVHKKVAPIQHLEGEEFLEAFLKQFDVTYTVEGVENVPIDRPIIFVSNHPNGFTDGVVALLELVRLKRDVRIVANDMMEKFEPLRKYFLPVNITDTRPKGQKRSSGIRQTMEEGRDLYILPAGWVSRIDDKGKVRDIEWKKTFVGLARTFKVCVVPMFINSRNTKFFYFITRYFDGLGKTLLMRELMKKAIKKKHVVFGRPVHYSQVGEFESDKKDKQIAQKFKDHLYSMGLKDEDVMPTFYPGIGKDLHKYGISLEDNAAGGKQLYIVDPDKSGLSPEELVKTELYQELGRIRHETFSRVNQQTTNKIDIDPTVDGVFSQLLVWDPYREKIAGGYRVALGGKLIKGDTAKDLYNKDLFNFTDEFTPILRNTVELGRSFVTSEYQHMNVREATYNLKALWEGIHRFIQNAHENGTPVRYLFGSVSIDPTMHPTSIERLVYLFTNEIKGDIDLNQYVSPRAPEYIIPEERKAVWKRNFAGKSYRENISSTKAFLFYHRDIFPILFHHYAGITEEGGVSYGRPVINPTRNNCIEVPLLLDLMKTKESQDKYYGKGSGYSILEYLAKHY